jgi:hypothetical protein
MTVLRALFGGMALSSEGASHSGSPRRSGRLGFALRAPSETTPKTDGAGKAPARSGIRADPP